MDSGLDRTDSDWRLLTKVPLQTDRTGQTDKDKELKLHNIPTHSTLTCHQASHASLSLLPPAPSALHTTTSPLRRTVAWHACVHSLHACSHIQFWSRLLRPLAFLPLSPLHALYHYTLYGLQASPHTPSFPSFSSPTSCRLSLQHSVFLWHFPSSWTDGQTDRRDRTGSSRHAFLFLW